MSYILYITYNNYIMVKNIFYVYVWIVYTYIHNLYYIKLRIDEWQYEERKEIVNK